MIARSGFAIPSPRGPGRFPTFWLSILAAALAWGPIYIDVPALFLPLQALSVVAAAALTVPLVSARFSPEPSFRARFDHHAPSMAPGLLLTGWWFFLRSTGSLLLSPQAPPEAARPVVLAVCASLVVLLFASLALLRFVLQVLLRPSP
jgi:hypothetical protein